MPEMTDMKQIDEEKLDGLMEEAKNEEATRMYITKDESESIMEIIKIRDTFNFREVDSTPTIEDTLAELFEKIERRQDWEENNNVC